MGEDSLTASPVADGRARADDDSPMIARVNRVEPAILESIEKGNFPLVAAQAQDVPQRTWTHWRSRADAGEPRFVELFERVSCALARAEEKLVDKLQDPPCDDMGRSDQGIIRSTQFLLERTRRERWGDKVEVRVKVEDSMRELLADLERLMDASAFDQLVVALSQIESDAGEG